MITVRPTRFGHLRSFPAFPLAAACALALACASSSPGGGSGGSPGSGTGGSHTGTGGASTGSGGATTGSGGATTGTGGVTTGSGGATAGTGGATTGGGGANTGAGGTVSTGGTTGSGGSNNRSGGSTGTGGTGAGGSNNGGHGGSTTGTGGSVAGTGGSMAIGGNDGSTSGGACPQDAIFCTGFEESSGAPSGTAVQTDSGKPFDQLMSLDKSSPFAGSQSLKVLSSGLTSGFDYRMLSVPVPATFWVRLYIKSDQDLGQSDHNAFFQAMTDPNHNNSANTLEISEQYCQIVLNDHDQTYPQGVACGTGGMPLAKNVWHCMETLFDGATGTVQVYADGTKIIDAENWSYGKASFNTFEFGLAQYHGPDRNTWYDELAIAPTRIGCE